MHPVKEGVPMSPTRHVGNALHLLLRLPLATCFQSGEQRPRHQQPLPPQDLQPNNKYTMCKGHQMEVCPAQQGSAHGRLAHIQPHTHIVVVQ